jgi:hypothetical protein
MCRCAALVVLLLLACGGRLDWAPQAGPDPYATGVDVERVPHFEVDIEAIFRTLPR